MQDITWKNLPSWTNVRMSTTRSTLLALLFVLVTNTRGAGASEAPRFLIMLHSQVEYGDTATLTCIHIAPDTAPPSSYEWIKDGEVIPGETRDTLTLKHVTGEDAGIYQCGEPNVNVSMPEFDLHVYYPEIPTPHILPLGQAVEGLGFGLHCCLPASYTGGHRIQYTWYKDNEEVAAHHSDELWFPRVREADAGYYSCAVREKPLEKESAPSSPFTLTPTEDDVKPNSSARVLQGVEGEQLNLTCELNETRPGASADSYSWSRIGQDRKRRPLVGNASTLTLGPLTRADAGLYVCQARNLEECRDVDLASFQVDIASVTQPGTPPASSEPEITGQGLSVGAIVGIVIAVIAFIAVITVITVIIFRRKLRRADHTENGYRLCQRGP